MKGAPTVVRKRGHTAKSFLSPLHPKFPLPTPKTYVHRGTYYLPHPTPLLLYLTLLRNHHTFLSLEVVILLFGPIINFALEHFAISSFGTERSNRLSPDSLHHFSPFLSFVTHLRRSLTRDCFVDVQVRESSLVSCPVLLLSSKIRSRKQTSQTTTPFLSFTQPAGIILPLRNTTTPSPLASFHLLAQPFPAFQQHSASYHNQANRSFLFFRSRYFS